jgi:hypothetical protein
VPVVNKLRHFTHATERRDHVRPPPRFLNELYVKTESLQLLVDHLSALPLAARGLTLAALSISLRRSEAEAPSTKPVIRDISSITETSTGLKLPKATLSLKNHRGKDMSKTADPVRILGIVGSPRKGNTDLLVREALKSAEAVGNVETELARAGLSLK